MNLLLKYQSEITIQAGTTGQTERLYQLSLCWAAQGNIYTYIAYAQNIQFEAVTLNNTQFGKENCKNVTQLQFKADKRGWKRVFFRLSRIIEEHSWVKTNQGLLVDGKKFKLTLETKVT